MIWLVNKTDKLFFESHFNRKEVILLANKKNLSIFSTVAEAAERLKEIIEHSFDGIYITDKDANTIKINHGSINNEYFIHNMKWHFSINLISFKSFKIQSAKIFFFVGWMLYCG